MPTTRIQRPLLSLVAHQKVLLFPLCFVVLCTAGCVPERRPKFHMADAALGHPIVPGPVPDDSLANVPDIEIDVAVAIPLLATVRAVPAKPKVTPPPATEPARTGKPTEPLIVPELTAEELSLAKGEAQHSLDVADHNLALAQGKRLNPAQSDLVSQVRGFAASARDAAHNGDWSRARNLAKKAELLSQELVGAL